VRAVRKDVTTQQCVPAFVGTRTVRWYGRYQNPTTGTLLVFVSDSNESQNVTTVASAAPAPTGTSFSHVFDSNGETEINVRYADAGQMQLNASYTGSVTTGDAGLTMTGSDSFVAVPVGFCVQARTPISAPTTALANCADSSCPFYQKAGVDFPLRIQAMAWQVDGETDSQFCSGNSLTPNFSGTVSLSHNMVDSTIEGSFSKPSVTLSAGTLDTTAAFSEVGRFVLTTGGNYFGAA
jgi:MSHA biogenesis protein MshQ